MGYSRMPNNSKAACLCSTDVKTEYPKIDYLLA